MPEGKGGLKNYPWEFEYRTSAQTPDGRAVDILRDFYVPALERSVDYRRVAGYFTSSSLAAAAQGFSVFTSSGGRMRLIAGADIAPEDVAAVLVGEEERLSRLLAERLEDRSWPRRSGAAWSFLAGWSRGACWRFASRSGCMPGREKGSPSIPWPTAMSTKSGRSSRTPSATRCLPPAR
ncbi:MAG: hypothetical protein PHX00_05225 [Synergistaceae bacterium]|nr:hypothetical protein [Synergistaceae bacterium]